MIPSDLLFSPQAQVILVSNSVDKSLHSLIAVSLVFLILVTFLVQLNSSAQPASAVGENQGSSTTFVSDPADLSEAFQLQLHASHKLAFHVVFMMLVSLYRREPAASHTHKHTHTHTHTHTHLLA